MTNDDSFDNDANEAIDGELIALYKTVAPTRSFGDQGLAAVHRRRAVRRRRRTAVIAAAGAIIAIASFAVLPLRPDGGQSQQVRTDFASAPGPIATEGDAGQEALAETPTPQATDADELPKSAQPSEASTVSTDPAGDTGATPTPTATAVPTAAAEQIVPATEPTPTPAAEATPTPTTIAEPTASPTPTAAEPTATPTPTAAEPTATPTPTAAEPTATPTPAEATPTPTPTAVALVDSSTRIVSVSPDPGTTLVAGETYTFTSVIDYGLAEIDPGFLEFSVYRFGALTGRLGDTQVSVSPGTGTQTLSVTVTIPTDAESVGLGSVLRRDAFTLISPSQLPEISYAVEGAVIVDSSTQILSASPEPGTILVPGETYTFSSVVDYVLAENGPAFLEFSVYAFGARTGRIGDAEVSVGPGSGRHTLSVTVTIPADAESIGLGSVLRRDAFTLISPFELPEISYSVG